MFQRLEPLVKAVDVVNSSITDEVKVNEALFKLLFPTRANLDERELISFFVKRNYDKIFEKALGMDTIKLKVRNQTKKLLDFMDNKILPKIYNNYNHAEYLDLEEMNKMPCLPSARLMYFTRRYERFDFDSYRKFRSISCLEDLNEIADLKTKQAFLRYKIIKNIDSIIDEILNAFNRADIIDDLPKTMHGPSKIQKRIDKVREFIALDSFSSNSFSLDREELLKKYCHSNHDCNKAQYILDGVCESLCLRYLPKRDISAIIYILYEKRVKIGFTYGMPETFARFQRLLCDYYRIDTPSYKKCKLAKEIDDYRCRKVWQEYKI